MKYRTPVMLLSDGYLANGAEPWRLPDLEDLPDIDPGFATAPNHTGPDGEEVFWPYIRDEETLARPWAPPGDPGLEHRIGGLEKADGSGNVSYDGANHERMSRLRAAQDRRHRQRHPPARGGRRRWRRQGVGGRLGLDLRGHRRRGQADAGPRARRWPTPTSSTSTRSRRTWGRCSPPTTRSSCPRSTSAS